MELENSSIILKDKSFMKVNFMMDINMEKANNFSKMAIHMQDAFLKINLKGWANINGKMVLFIKERLLMGISMDKEFLFLQMEANLKNIMITINKSILIIAMIKKQ